MKNHPSLKQADITSGRRVAYLLPIYFLLMGVAPCSKTKTPDVVSSPAVGVSSKIAPYTRHGTTIKIDFLDTAGFAFTQDEANIIKALLDKIPTSQLKGLKHIQADAKAFAPTSDTIYFRPTSTTNDAETEMETQLADWLWNWIFSAAEKKDWKTIIQQTVYGSDGAPIEPPDALTEFEKSYRSWMSGGSELFTGTVPTYDGSPSGAPTIQQVQRGLTLAALFSDPSSMYTIVYDASGRPRAAQVVYSNQPLYADQIAGPGAGGYISIDGQLVASLDENGNIVSPTTIYNSNGDPINPGAVPVPEIFKEEFQLSDTPSPFVNDKIRSQMPHAFKTPPPLVVRDPNGGPIVPGVVISAKAPDQSYVPLEKGSKLYSVPQKALTAAQQLSQVKDVGEIGAAERNAARSHDVTVSR